MNDMIQLDADGIAAVKFLEDVLKTAGHPVRETVLKGRLTPILPTTPPQPSNRKITEGEPEIDTLLRQMAESTSWSIQQRPLGQKESRQARVAWQMANDPDYRALYARYAALLRSDAQPTTKADQERQAEAEQAIYEGGAEFARQRGISVEKARTILRKAYPRIALAELGR